MNALKSTLSLFNTQVIETSIGAPLDDVNNSQNPMSGVDGTEEEHSSHASIDTPRFISFIFDIPSEIRFSPNRENLYSFSLCIELYKPNVHAV